MNSWFLPILPVPNLNENDRFRCLCIYIHKQRYVYLAIMYSIYDGVAEYPVTIDLAVDCCARMIYII